MELDPDLERIASRALSEAEIGSSDYMTITNRAVQIVKTVRPELSPAAVRFAVNHAWRG
ncbi:MAG: hypothetical protein AAF530_18155 [Pseudomonadota bacterium]